MSTSLLCDDIISTMFYSIDSPLSQLFFFTLNIGYFSPEHERFSGSALLLLLQFLIDSVFTLCHRLQSHRKQFFQFPAKLFGTSFDYLSGTAG